ncbi:hypothetical protein [Variovorax ginsengisoli]|jgi:hypothetical protein|uniref:Uncharacterized protein n=1 Tax=Variovorax ginsengisoli TaxID=363844 RepID=A0ABT8RWB0_9BURK|nr:hypothetical protein [Variovorax ginsengisoli]MDN8611704.1 hypothetical protein [Variovorax ginsengisoli]MDO1530874.1 hypothetical protein [Variovorax ginsengisoli]
MGAERQPLTPQQRLALSRRALVAQLQGDRPEAPQDELSALPAPAVRPAVYDHFAWSSVARGVVRRWWRRHPANAAGQLARPLLERYAREEPAKLVGAAAAAGALVVLVKPWRLLSITAVLAAVVKTSDVADMVTTLMQKNANPRKDPP